MTFNCDLENLPKHYCWTLQEALCSGTKAWTMAINLTGTNLAHDMRHDQLV